MTGLQPPNQRHDIVFWWIVSRRLKWRRGYDSFTKLFCYMSGAKGEKSTTLPVSCETTTKSVEDGFSLCRIAMIHLPPFQTIFFTSGLVHPSSINFILAFRTTRAKAASSGSGPQEHKMQNNDNMELCRHRLFVWESLIVNRCSSEQSFGTKRVCQLDLIRIYEKSHSLANESAKGFLSSVSLKKLFSSIIEN